MATDDTGHGPEGPDRRSLNEVELDEEGVAFAPFVTEEQKRAFFDAITCEAEKRVLVMPEAVEFTYVPAPSGNVEGANK